MTDLFLALCALLAFVAVTLALYRAYFNSATPKFGPPIHFSPTSELLYMAAPDIRDGVIREAILDRAAQLEAAGD